MSTPSITDLRATWSRRDYSTNSQSRAAINLLADGKPVTPQAAAAATGLSLEEVEAYIENARRKGVEVEDGAVVGAALTLRPTGHRFRVRGNDLYTWCGFDALFLPVMLGERAEVASTCPVTETEIRLTVEPDGTVSTVTPSTVVVGIVGEEITSCCSAAGPHSEICTQMPFFASREAGEHWLVDHPGVAVVDLSDAREIARAYVQEGCCSTRTTELAGSFLALPGRQLWVERTGEGPTVIFAHAGIADRRMWDGAVGALADRYHVVRYDQPGYGRSDAATEPYSPVAELDAVLDHVNAEQAALVGASMGGAIAIDYTLAHSNRVAALVTAGAGLTGFPGKGDPGEAELAAAIEADDPGRIAEGAMRMWAPLRTDPAVDARIRQLIVDNVAGIATMGTMWRLGQPAYGQLGSIDVPTLAIVGDRDLDDFIQVAKLLASEIDGARLEVLPEVDHNVPVRAGRAFTDLLADFLDKLDRSQWGRTR